MHIPRGVVFVAERYVVRYPMQTTTRFKRRADSPFRSTGNEHAEREVSVEDAMLDGSQQLRLSIFSLASVAHVEVGRASRIVRLALAFVEAVDENYVWKAVDMDCFTPTEIFEGEYNKAVHLGLY